MTITVDVAETRTGETVRRVVSIFDGKSIFFEINGVDREWVKHLRFSILKNRARQIPDVLMRFVR